MFDINLYNDLLRIANKRIFDYGYSSFTAHDVVHDLYLIEDNLCLHGCCKKLIGLIKTEANSFIKNKIAPIVFEDTYTCNCCNESLPVAAFKIVDDISVGAKFVSAKCLDCENTISLQYYYTKKDDQAYKEKARERTRLWSAANKEKRQAAQRERAKDPTYKAYLKNWRQNKKSLAA